jgi:phospholipase C
VAALSAALAASVGGLAGTTAALADPATPHTAQTPIKHVVVIYDENISYDHYFGTYPSAANNPGEGTPFTAAAGTPTNNNLVTANLLTGNPNSEQPQRLTPAEAVTCDQNHNYTPEQKAEDGGLMDKFVENTSATTCTGVFNEPGLPMDYYDGNTVTGLWNYAQNYSLSDNSWDAGFGPSTPGALNLISGDTHGVESIDPTTGEKTDPDTAYGNKVPDADGIGTVINDPDPAYDDCADANHTSTSKLAAMQGKNIGDLLNDANVTWGWFQGGFTPNVTAANSPTGLAQCTSSTANVNGTAAEDYSPHHNPFEYYQSTSNPHHLPPTPGVQIGAKDDSGANHEYDLSVFNDAVKTGDIPSVSYLKAPEAQDGHASYSDPLDEQKFLVTEINAIEQSPTWSSTAIVISYDDSDGWYDHVAPTILNGSDVAADDTSLCMDAANGNAPPLDGDQDRCGPSQRLPMLVISPYAKKNFIDDSLTTQVSILGFIEDNWDTGKIAEGSFDTEVQAFPTGQLSTDADEPIKSLANMFDFSAAPNDTPVLLDPVTGAVDTTTQTTPPPSSTPPPASSTPATSAPATSSAAPAPSSTNAGLANTGTRVTGLFGIAIVLIGAGAGAWFVARRRREHV